MSDLGDLKGMLVLKWYSRCTFLTSHIWNIKYGKYNIAPTHSEQHNCLFHPFMCICQSQRHQTKKQSQNVSHFIQSIIQLIDIKFTKILPQRKGLYKPQRQVFLNAVEWLIVLKGFCFVSYCPEKKKCSHVKGGYNKLKRKKREKPII